LPLATKLAKIAACTLVYLVVFDIVGAVACFVFEFVGVERAGITAAVYYALWFVLGVFCGLLNYNTAGSMAYPKSESDWTRRADAPKTGLLVVAISVFILIGLSVLFFSILWRGGAETDPYVPDSMPLTLTFFAATVAATFLAHHIARPSPKRV
jgi:hypothetical protein